MLKLGEHFHSFGMVVPASIGASITIDAPIIHIIGDYHEINVYLL